MAHGPFSNKDELSSNDFQQRLYRWFQDRGLITELRSHLRRQMIIALRDTSLDPGRCRQSVSPKLQALNLLLAEFLLQNNYHYTLSVFSSEVPLLANVPEFSSSIYNSVAKTELSDPPRFQKCDVRDILQALGIPPDSKEGQKIFHLYHDVTAREPLLKCILSLFSPILGSDKAGVSSLAQNESDEVRQPVKTDASRFSTSVVRNGTNFKDDETNGMKSKQNGIDVQWTHDLRQGLIESQLENQRIKQLQEEMKRFYESEVEKVREEQESKYRQEILEREKRIQEELGKREEEMKRRIQEADEHQAEQKLLLENELVQKRKHLLDLMTQLHDQQEEVQKRMNEVEEKGKALKAHEEAWEKQMEEMQKREDEKLAKKYVELDLLERKLEEDSERLKREREEMNEVRKELERSRSHLERVSCALDQSQAEVSSLRDLQQICAQLKEELERTRTQLKELQTRTAAVQFESEAPSSRAASRSFHHRTREGASEMSIVPQSECTTNKCQRLKEELNRLCNENSDLRTNTEQQRLRIHELTKRASYLANELEESHLAIRKSRVSSRVSSPPATPPPPPPSPPPPTQPSVTPAPFPFVMPPIIQSYFHPSVLGLGDGLARSQSPTKHPSPQREETERRRRPLKRMVSHYDSDSTDVSSSPTDEILHEARRRLRKLEEESEEVDRNYRNFRLRQAYHFASVPYSIPTVLSRPSVISKPILPTSYTHGSMFLYNVLDKQAPPTTSASNANYTVPASQPFHLCQCSTVTRTDPATNITDLSHVMTSPQLLTETVSATKVPKISGLPGGSKNWLKSLREGPFLTKATSSSLFPDETVHTTSNNQYHRGSVSPILDLISDAFPLYTATSFKPITPSSSQHTLFSSVPSKNLQTGTNTNDLLSPVVQNSHFPNQNEPFLTSSNTRFAARSTNTFNKLGHVHSCSTTPDLEYSLNCMRDSELFSINSDDRQRLTDRHLTLLHNTSSKPFEDGLYPRNYANKSSTSLLYTSEFPKSSVVLPHERLIPSFSKSTRSKSMDSASRGKPFGNKKFHSTTYTDLSEKSDHPVTEGTRKSVEQLLENTNSLFQISSSEVSNNAAKELQNKVNFKETKPIRPKYPYPDVKESLLPQSPGRHLQDYLHSKYTSSFLHSQNKSQDENDPDKCTIQRTDERDQGKTENMKSRKFDVRKNKLHAEKSNSTSSSSEREPFHVSLDKSSAGTVQYLKRDSNKQTVSSKLEDGIDLTERSNYKSPPPPVTQVPLSDSPRNSPFLSGDESSVASLKPSSKKLIEEVVLKNDKPSLDNNMEDHNSFISMHKTNKSSDNSLSSLPKDKSAELHKAQDGSDYIHKKENEKEQTAFAAAATKEDLREPFQRDTSARYPKFHTFQEKEHVTSSSAEDVDDSQISCGDLVAREENDDEW